jgi:predicted dehydrogenase
LRYGGNLIAHFHFNWLAPVKVRQTIVCGSKKMIVYNDLEPDEKIKIFDKGVDVNAAANDIETRSNTLISYRSGDMYSPRIAPTEALASAAREFIQAIAERRAPLSDGEAGLGVVRILAAAQRSLDMGGQPVDV